MLSVLLLFLASYACVNNFNGTWQLDFSRSESPNEILKLIGIGFIPRSVMCNLAITEIYIVTHRSVNIERKTSQSHTNDLYFFGVSVDKVDRVLGRGTRVVTVDNAGNLYTKFTRSDNAIFTSVDELISDQEIRMTMKFTTPSPQSMQLVRRSHNFSARSQAAISITCVRTFKRV